MVFFLQLPVMKFGMKMKLCVLREWLRYDDDDLLSTFAYESTLGKFLVICKPTGKVLDKNDELDG